MTGMLQGRCALVTGAGSGIGRDLALVLAGLGARVGVAARRMESGEETVRMISERGGEALALGMDVTVEASVADGIAGLVKRFGGLDIVVHNANNSASGYPAPADAVTRENWQAQSRVALGGAFLTARAAHRYLAVSGHARYLTLSSTFGFHGAAMNTIYSAQKAAFRGFVGSLAREWGPDGITVNAVCPAAATDATRAFFDQNPPMRDAYIRKFPLGRLGDPMQDLAQPIAALCTAAFAYMTGHILFLDGGVYPAA